MPPSSGRDPELNQATRRMLEATIEWGIPPRRANKGVIMEPTRLLEIRDRQTLTIPDAQLAVVRGPDTGSRAPVGLEQMVVGSAPTAHLRLQDPTVSRHHFVLRTTPDGYVITDLGSTNGTRLERRRIQSAYLS